MNEEIEYSNEKISFSVWKKILKLVFKRKKNIIVMILSVIGLGSLDVLFPYLMSQTIEVFFGETPDFSLKWLFIALFVAMALAYGIVIFLFIYMAGVVEVNVADEIRKEAFVKLQSLPFSYYDKTQAGWIMARLTSDSRKLAEIISWGMVDIVWGAATMTGIIVMLYVTFWPLALVITVLTPLLFVICIYFRKTILVAYRKVRKINSQITGSFNEGILGSKTTKTLVLEESRNKEFKELCTNMKKHSVRAIVRTSLFWPIILVLAYIGVGITLRLGVGFVLGEFKGYVITASVLYLFIDYTRMFFDPIMTIARILAEFQQAQASAERIMGLIETELEIDDTLEVKEKYGTLTNPKKENWEELKGDIRFENVSFSYNEKELVLKNFSLDVKQGESVALVGSTGSGKSTIVNLLCRFYEPNQGRILIDGKDYKDRSLSWLHSNLGYVLQSPHLFNGTIRENVRYGKLDASDEEILQALRSVNADVLVDKLSDGLDTMVGEGGSKLSIGEKQLISFARALIKDPRILILDEATSSIDTETEHIIQSAINKLLVGRTTFIVAHRLSTIINSDKILVISNGEIIEQGTHKELLMKKGEYYNLYKNQFINEGIESSIK